MLLNINQTSSMNFHGSEYFSEINLLLMANKSMQKDFGISFESIFVNVGKRACRSFRGSNTLMKSGIKIKLQKNQRL